jgi:hypothetical protein
VNQPFWVSSLSPAINFKQNPFALKTFCLSRTEISPVAPSGVIWPEISVVTDWLETWTSPEQLVPEIEIVAPGKPSPSISSSPQPEVQGAATSELSVLFSSTIWDVGRRAIVSGFMLGSTPLMGRKSKRQSFCRILMRDGVRVTSAMT